jgi:hypothetical protein
MEPYIVAGIALCGTLITASLALWGQSRARKRVAHEQFECALVQRRHMAEVVERRHHPPQTVAFGELPQLRRETLLVGHHLLEPLRHRGEHLKHLRDALDATHAADPSSGSSTVSESEDVRTRRGLVVAVVDEECISGRDRGEQYGVVVSHSAAASSITSASSGGELGLVRSSPALRADQKRISRPMPVDCAEVVVRVARERV